MVKLQKLARYSLGIVLAAVLLGAGGAYVYLRPSLPAAGQLAAPGLQAPVEVIRDRWGIAHVYAQNEQDLFFAQGYVQAQDRLWQMEVSRRAARGTLAELLGESALAGDRLARTLGFARAAEAEWAALDAESRLALEAYARGVNAFLSAGRRLPLEFTLLGLAPEPWQPQDSLAWARLLAWSMDGDWQAELVRARLLQALGPERAAQLEPALAAALQAGYVGEAAVQVPSLLEEVGGAWPWASAGGMGGSAWAVSGAETATGAPILASAPLLPVQMPSAWHEIHLVGGGYDVIGASFPGLPGVALGRNRTIAWGLSSSAVDSMDLYVERVRPGDPPQAEFQGHWEALQMREEEVRVRGRAEPERLKVYGTRHGPLVSGLEAGAPEQLALSWTGEGQPATLARQLIALGRAKDWPAFTEALTGWAAPALTVSYADVRGNLGYAAVGGMPDRSTGDGLLPSHGWMGTHEWSPRVVAEPLLELRPAGSTLIAAGGTVAPDGWPECAWDGAQPPAAAVRIAELIRASAPLTVEDVQGVQNDDRGPEQPLLALLLERPPQGWLQERTTPYLRGWDLRYDADSAGAGIYEAYYYWLVHNTLDDDLSPGLVDAYLNACPGHRAAMEKLALDADNPWFDDRRTPETEGRDEIIARSYADAIEWLGRRFGDLAYEWNWGRVHNVTFRHALEPDWPLNLLLNRGAMRAGGGPDCVAATGTDYAARMAVASVPYRLIVDLGEGGQVVAMNSTGQSGNAISAHYADMIQPWRDGRYHPLLYDRQAVVEAMAGRLALTPAQ